MNNEKISNIWRRNYIFIPIVVSLISLIVSILVIADPNKPVGYDFFFLLPLSFSLLSLLFQKLFLYIKNNLAVAIFLILFFCRLVISPLFMYIGNYSVTIQLNISENTTPAVFLVVYETTALFCFLLLKVNENRKNIQKVTDNDTKKINISGTYLCILFSLFLLLVLCARIVPEIVTSYRTIFQIGDEFFTNYEDSQVVDKYAVDFISKLAIVTGHYLMRALLLIIPASIIVLLSRKKRSFISKTFAFVLCFIPLFFIGGAIARSLIYTICLFFLYSNIFENNRSRNNSVLILSFGGTIVILWWLFKAPQDDLLASFSRRFSAYFSGVNVVSGVFNLPQDYSFKLRYFIYDFATTIPYGHTIFRISDITIQPFFNACNNSFGQIPPTIGMGYYYFGPLLAPIYSLVFAKISFDSALYVGKDVCKNPFRQIRLLLMTFIFAMGVVMYNIEITMIYFFSLILPLYLIEKIAYPKDFIDVDKKNSLLLVRRQAIK